MINLAYFRDNITNHQDFDVFSQVHIQSGQNINTICAHTSSDEPNFAWDSGKIRRFRIPKNSSWVDLAESFDIIDTSEFYRTYSMDILNHFPKKKSVTVFDNLPFGISQGYAGELSKLANVVIARSPMIRRMLIREGVPDQKIHIVPSAVDIELFKPGYMTGNYPIVLFVGRIVPEKGLWDLITAMSGLNAELQVAGEGDIRPYEELAKLAGVKLKFLGPVSHQELPAVMKRASILCVPSIPKIDIYNPEASWVEQFGVVIIEGMATSIPVIASDTGSTRDIIAHGETGFVFPPRSWDILRNHIDTLLKNNAMRNSMGARGRDKVTRLFSAQVVGKMLANIYGNL